MKSLESYETLNIVRAQLNYVVFKEFFKHYDMPKGMKQVHAMTLKKLLYKKLVSMTELSYALNLEKSSVTSISDKLHELGFIVSERSKEDRRVYHLKLTDEGEKFALQIEEDHRKYLDNVFDELDEESLNKLFESLEYVNKMFSSLSVTQKFLSK